MHKYDPKTYTITAFTPEGRRYGQRSRGNFQASKDLADRWRSMTGGTAVVVMCLYNNALSRPVMPKGEQ